MDQGKFDFCIGTADLNLKRQLIGILSAAGFNSTGSAASTPELLRLLRSVQPWLAVIDVNIPPGNLEQLASIIEEDGLAAAVYVGVISPPLEQQIRLPWPVDAPVLTAVAEALCLEFARKKNLRREIGQLKQKLADRREIEKAKGILTRKFSITEEEAFRYLRNYSMKARITLVEAARSVMIDPGGPALF